MTQQLLLKSYQSPGDIVMLSAAVRDLHRAYPARFVTDVRTSAPAVWEHNPYLTPLGEGVAGVRELDMHYPAIHQSNQRPYHFIHGFTQYLEQKLELRIPVTRFAGDIYLSEEEKQAPPLREFGVPDRYWIVVAGGKHDFTSKWWEPSRFQAVVDHFAGRIRFVQCGAAEHWHPPLERVVNLVGRTSLRQLIQLVHHADGVLCSVTLAMHLAAAVAPKPGCCGPRPCVVVAGGREPAHWEAYPNHQFLSTNGALNCCRKGGCWKSRCQRVGDGDAKDSQNVCERPVQVDDNLRIPRCMDLITAQDVIRRIELFCQEETAASPATVPKNDHPIRSAATTVRRQRKISVGFFHGLGDCAYFAHLIPLYQSRGYEVEVRCEENKRFLFEAAGAVVRQDGNLPPHPWGYPPGHTHEGQGRFWQGSKMGHNISRAPLPNIGSTSDLWQEYCQVRIPLESQLPAAALRTAEQWLSRLPRPVVLLHTKGNSGQTRKSLPDDVTAQFYRAFIEQCDGTLLLLDWDHRVPRLASYRVRHLDEFGECPLECLLALLSRADLLIGIDSGPLHVARFTSIPTIGLWMPGHYPATYTLPREMQLNVVLADHTRTWNKYKRIPWTIVEHPGNRFDAAHLAQLCADMLGAPRYLDRGQLAADLQLRQFVRDWCRGPRGNALSAYSDRDRSFDVLLREMTRRFQTPTVVETGTIRAEEDWSGAGFFTYLAGAYLQQRGGHLHSVDLHEQHCRFARDWTAVFGDTVKVTAQDSVEFLRRFAQPIDLLYLDSLDTTEPGHAEHALQEVQAALPRLHPHSLILLDDTPWQDGAWIGKGAQAVPYLLTQGWQVLYAGYQVILTRNDIRRPHAE